MSEDANRRADVTNMYPGKRWAQKVQRMSDAQVFAIWKNQQNRAAEEQLRKKLDAQAPPQEEFPF